MSRWRPCWPPCPCTPSCGSGKFSQSSPRKALLRLPASAASLSAHQHPPPGCLEKVKQVTVFKQRRHVCQLRDEDQGTVPIVPICRVRPSRPDVVRQVKRVAIAPSVVVSKRQSLWVLKWVMSQFSSQSCKAKSHLSHPCMPARPFLRPREGSCSGTIQQWQVHQSDSATEPPWLPKSYSFSWPQATRRMWSQVVMAQLTSDGERPIDSTDDDIRSTVCHDHVECISVPVGDM